MTSASEQPWPPNSYRFKKKQNFNFNRERMQKNRPVKYDERWGLKVIVSESQNTAETAILKSQLKT